MFLYSRSIAPELVAGRNGLELTAFSRHVGSLPRRSWFGLLNVSEFGEGRCTYAGIGRGRQRGQLLCVSQRASRYPIDRGMSTLCESQCDSASLLVESRPWHAPFVVSKCTLSMAASISSGLSLEGR